MSRKMIVLLAVLVLMLAVPAGAASGSNLVGWWKLDGNAHDTMRGHKGDGDVEGVEEWIEGYFADALSFDGRTTYVDLPIDEMMMTLTNSTFSAWVNWGGNSGSRVHQSIFHFGTSGTEGYMFLSPDSLNSGAHVMRYAISPPGEDAEQQITVSKLWPVDEWHHAAVVIDADAGVTYLYKDARVAGQGDIALTPSDLGTPSKNWLGRPIWNNPFFGGAIDDFRIYDAALTADELQRVMEGGLGSEVATVVRPEQDEADVELDVVLEWFPGVFAAAHDLYFGIHADEVEQATRADPMGVLVEEGTTATTWATTPPLEFDRSYYWRVDEVNDAEPDSPWKGRLWRFTTEPYAYPIAPDLISATASSVDSIDTDPDAAGNGAGLDGDGLHDDFKAGMWLSSTSDQEPWIRFDFDRVYKLHELSVWNYNSAIENIAGQGIKEAKIESLDAAENWFELHAASAFNQAPGEPGYAANTSVPLNGVATQSIRITALSSWSQLPQLFPQKGLSEVQFVYIPVRPREPVPASGATGVAPDQTLAWRVGREANQHVVSIGTDPDALASADPVGQGRFDTAPLDLELGQTYHWQVTEVNETADPTTWKGDIWRFTVQERLVVDGFESYTDDDVAGEAIWQTWIDGFSLPGNGSQVGHVNAPYAERTIVHDGRVAMPFFYDNTAGATISESTRTFGEPRDFTGHSAQGLVLYFHGDPANTGGQLYVKINNTKIAYDGDPADLMRTGWNKWYIVLADVVGTDVSQVNSLTIGIDSGGKGVIYVDDILLTPEVRNLITPVEPDIANLVGYYPLDEGSGTRVSDASGKNHGGTFLGNPRWVAGRVGSGALDIPGEGSSVELGTWNPSERSGQLSVWLWLKWGGLDGRWQ
ncbi:MAG: discoidin domain-containing protein, partial [Planctomycetes bacterium]|nr:discoidin domain-containing protein [Planctomycetota bacterium]